METKDHTEIDLREIIQIVLKRWWLIAVISILAAVASGIYSYFFITPQYQASAEILVNQANTESISQGDIRTNMDLINTYSVIITSSRILEQVIEEHNLTMSHAQLNSKVDVGAVRNSQVMSVTITDPSYQQAVYLANAIANTFEQEIINLMNIDNVHIMAYANENLSPRPVSPRPNLNIAIAFVVGLMAAVGLVFLLEYLDTTIKTEQDLENTLGLPILGSIAKMEETPTRKGKRSITTTTNSGGESLNA